MRVAIGADEAGFELKEALKKYIGSLGHEVVDYGAYDQSPVLYPDIANLVAGAIAGGAQDRGVLVCGTGIGMAMMANKVPGVRAAQAHDTYSAERAVKSNDAQIVTMGARVIGSELAKCIVKVFLESTFVDGPSTPKVERIMYYERAYRSGHGVEPKGK
jgi:ribose 5-phosphate isomerase B